MLESSLRVDCFAAFAALLLEPGHDLMQPPSHSAFADFYALWKLALFLEPQDVLRRVWHQLAFRGCASLSDVGRLLPAIFTTRYPHRFR
jgi:hypothetical protein